MKPQSIRLSSLARPLYLLAAIAMPYHGHQASAQQPAAPIEAALPHASAAWEKRNGAEQTQLAADAFLDMLVLDGSIRKPLLTDTANLAKTDKKAAFELYMVQFMKRLREGEYNGMAAVMDLGGKAPDDAQTLKAADDLMLGFINVDRKRVHIGEPGQVDWSAPWDDNKVYPAQVNLHTSAAFLPLGQAFLATNERKYLDRWMAYLDDWTLNDTYFARQHPLQVPDNVNAQTGMVVVVTMKLLAQAGEPARKAGDALAPRVMGQVMRRFLMEQLLSGVTYLRSNTHNWTPSTRLLRIARIFEDFRPAQFYFREGLRRNVEDNAVTQNLRDGTENQQDHWYNASYLDLSDIFRLLETESTLPGWNDLRNDYEWQQQMKRGFAARATYLIHDRTPQNTLPLAWNGGFTRRPETGEVFQAPGAFYDPTNQAILRAVNGDRDADPGFDSEWFPYGGFNLVRDGWDKNSAYGAMFSSPQPGAYGGYRSRSNNNVFGLSAYGQDLLIDDATGHYMYPSSPLRVDGRDQFFHAGLYKAAAPESHKVFQVNAWWQPANWRWHASGAFNLMEGVYAGAYAKPDDVVRQQGPYGTDESQTGTIPAGTGINDVTHQRLVLYVRDAKLWIIDDRLRSLGTHEYAQQWLFPLRPNEKVVAPSEIRTAPSFDAGKIVLNAANKKIATNELAVPVKKNDESYQDTPKANLSLYQFSAMPLTYTATPKPRDKDGKFYMYYGWDRVESKWKGTGPQQVVTLAFPRAPGLGAEGDLKSTRQITGGKSGVGFEAVTPGGKTVQYLSSVASDELTLGTVAIQGEALLLSGGKGMALGASRMTVGGKPVTLATADFEFDLNGATPRLTPIYRPIAPVEIGPQADVFTDRAEVTLESKTPGVQIRYTLDGSEPTPQSALYAEPIALTKTTTVMARAYRPGVTQNPLQQSGTHASPVSTARFEKQGAVAAVNPTRPSTGLNVRYYEGDWKKMMLDFDRQQPTATGKTAALWDAALIPAPNGPVDAKAGARTKPYALEYSGFLNAPAAGVYTLQAPEEYVWPATEAGYELRVWLGNQMGKGAFSDRVVGTNLWYPGTRMHGFGTWSVALQKGLHPFRVVFIDYRTDAAKKLNKPGLKGYIWEGATPNLLISGPGLKPQTIPAGWLMRPMDRPQ